MSITTRIHSSPLILIESTRSSESDLSDKSRRLLFQTHRASDQGRALLSVFTDMINNGWDWTSAVNRILSTDRKQAVAFVEGMSVARAREFWVRAEAWVAEHPSFDDPTEALHRLGEIRSALTASGPWRGRNSLRDRAVLEAVHAHATGRKRVVLPLATRTIESLTGGAVPFKTAARALKSLVELGWLKLESSGADRKACTYRLIKPSHQHVAASDTRPEGTPPCRACVPSTAIDAPTAPTDDRLHELMATDVFRELGTQAARLWLHLHGATPVRIVDLVAVSGASRSTVKKYLGLLAKEDLVDKGPDGWTRVEVDLEALARDMGVDGRVEASRARIAAERLLWARTSQELRQAARDRHRARQEVATLPTKHQRRRRRKQLETRLGMSIVKAV
jgi:hypothetical protein